MLVRAFFTAFRMTARLIVPLFLGVLIVLLFAVAGGLVYISHAFIGPSGPVISLSGSRPLSMQSCLACCSVMFRLLQCYPRS